MKNFSVVAFAAFCASCAGNPPATPAHPAIPPEFFEKVCCWISDNEEPVMTEINLDAVERNRNEASGLRARSDEWVGREKENNEGFSRYRFLPDENGHHMVEYQENGGGTLTTSTRIGFSILTRTILKDGKPTPIRVLRVESIANVAQPEKQKTFPK